MIKRPTRRDASRTVTMTIPGTDYVAYHIRTDHRVARRSGGVPQVFSSKEMAQKYIDAMPTR